MRNLVLVVLLALVVALPARAGGIYANEFGTPEMGTAGAGAEASALDASTAIPFYNPAAMTRLKGDQVIVGAGALFASVEFELDPATTISGGDGGQAAGTIPLLTGAYVHSFSDRLKLGVALYSTAGAALDYEPDWAGRYQSQKTAIVALSLSPTLAYRVNEWLSIGGGLNVTASALETRVAGLVGQDPQIVIDGTDTQVTFNLSTLFELSESTRIGLSYISETEFDYAGDVTRNPSGQVGAVDTTLTLAALLRAGFHHDFNDRIAVVGTLGWEDWSALNKQFITVGSLNPFSLDRNWKDTYRVGAGLHYRLSDPWLLRFGINYDSSPTDAADRTADLPVDAQLRIAGGFQNERSEKFSWGAQLLYADLGSAGIERSSLLGDLVGRYQSNDYLGAAFNLEWRF